MKNDKADKQSSMETTINLLGIWVNSLSEHIYDATAIENS